MKVLVTGGAGYIGSHMVLKLLESGHTPVVIDNFSTGQRALVPSDVKLYTIDVGDKAQLLRVFKNEDFDIVMHFAAFIEVGESVKCPEKYYRNNVMNLLTLLEVMRESNVYRLIFSSTAAIFGEPVYVPADEQHPKNAINPYGMSKWMGEQIIRDFEIAYGIKSVCLRYFNAAGADAKARTGYRCNDASHLIPIALQAALGKRPFVEVFGSDYDTHDGTCIRDYIHIMDLCDAHLLAMNYLLDGGNSRQYNLGNGSGYSVRQVIEAAKKVTQRKFRVIDGSRRPGDPAALYANAALAKKELGWCPVFTDLEEIIRHAWQWELKVLAEQS